MRLIDLSQPVYDACPNCPAHPPVRVEMRDTHESGDWQLETLEMATHTGSHLDAPRHKIASGATVSELPLETFCGQALILDLRPCAPNEELQPKRLIAAARGQSLQDVIVLLATGWGELRAHTDEWLRHSPFLSPSGAAWLVGQGARAVGIDHYSVGGSREPGNAQTHTVLLEAGLWIVEELHFPEEVFALAQPLRFMALPLNLSGASGAPCRPVLLLDSNS